MNQFEKDYEQSRKVELQFMQILATHYNCLVEDTAQLGAFPDYDVSATAQTKEVTTYEVKDQTCHDDDSVFIELWKAENGYQKPAGLSASKADYYVFKFQCDPDFYLIKKDTLQTLIQAQEYKKTFMDKGMYCLAIFDRQAFTKHCFTL